MKRRFFNQFLMIFPFSKLCKSHSIDIPKSMAISHRSWIVPSVILSQIEIWGSGGTNTSTLLSTNPNETITFTVGRN